MRQRYVVPRDGIHLDTDDPRIVALADRLWERAPAGAPISGVPPLGLRLRVEPDGGVPGTAGSALPTEQWDVQPDRVELTLGDELAVTIDVTRATARGWISAGLLARDPALVGRLGLETPAAALLERRAYAVVHAGAVAGPAGAIIIRGAPGTGKSTLVAAAYRAGLEVLGDESVLVARDEPDTLLVAVRDLTLRPEAAALLGLDHAATPAYVGGEVKARVALPPPSGPGARSRRRAATVILGPRNGGAARLETLDPAAFVREFQDGAIAQEQWSGTPGDLGSRWSRRGAYRLSGTNDLAGAVTLLLRLAATPL